MRTIHAGRVRLLLILFCLPRVALPQDKRLGQLSDGTEVVFRRSGDWGMELRRGGRVVWRNPMPLRVQQKTVDDGSETITNHANAYADVRIARNVATATGVLPIAAGQKGQYRITDTWTLAGQELRLSRTLTVAGDGPANTGFVSEVFFETTQAYPRDSTRLFLPGNVYGTTENLQDAAIGGRDTYTKGGGLVQVREDRLPVPMADLSFGDGRFVTLLNPKPDGRTTNADSEDFRSPQQSDGTQKPQPQASPKTLVDERFRFGALQIRHGKDALRLGYVFPGAEGEVTYRGIVYPLAASRQWRWRLHPIRDGLTQQYTLVFRFGTASAGSSEQTFSTHLADTWRWAWQTLQPQVVRHDIPQMRDILSDFLVKRVAQSPDGRWGFPYLVDGFANYKYIMSDAVMGFCGKNIETSYYLIEEAERTGKLQYRAVAEKVINSFVPIRMNPPAAEGFDLLTGKPMVTMFYEGNEIYLRPLTDDFKMMVNLLIAERRRGREHPDWLAWTRSFGDWLLTQQRPDGGIPRKWEPGTGRVIMDAPQSSYNAVPFLAKLGQFTGETKYLDAAKRIGDFSWRSGHARGLFVGGTIDNPNVIDKEAGTLSLEAYLALYEATQDRKWLDYAQASANYAETWIYLWNVPMPADADASKLGVKPGVPSTGFQLISTGHSLADAYMSFDVDEYAKLYKYTGDAHYRDVARLLLHNTKSLIGLPGRQYDLPDLGYQQEHFGFGPARGQGMHRWWLPWVTTSHLNGIVGLEQFDKALYNELCRE